ncbi:Hypothetical_protein [Hexamita inflata]|uniref:Hypothetical_protein n=1 Tax=Hexamita inflata TaxID=28002 RepID=A0AA86QNK4_9EUKA|nr:Hypothetical protein HINF_LOCUS45098 [Hexamita inflata]
MPFEAWQQNGQNLTIQWQEEVDQEFSIDTLNSRYKMITIIGQKNNTGQNLTLLPFSLPLLFNKTSNMKIYYCDVILLGVDRTMKSLQLNWCRCFCNPNNLVIDKLFLYDSMLNNINPSIRTNTLQLYITNAESFDVKQYDQLKYQNRILNVSISELDLSTLYGCWDEIFLEICTFKGQLSKDALQTKCLSIYECDSKYLKLFENVVCDKLDIFCSANEQDNTYNFQLNHKATELVSYFNSYQCDFSNPQGKWNQIQLEKCKIISSDPTSTVLQDTKMYIELHDDAVFDSDPQVVQGIKAKLWILAERCNNLDLVRIQQCAPLKLQLSQCTVDLVQMQGSWNQLKLSECTFINQDSLLSIKANSVKFRKTDLKSTKNFTSNFISVSQNELSESSTILSINKEVVNIQQNYEHIHTVEIINCTSFQKFSLTSFPNLNSFSLKTDSKYETKREIVDKQNKMFQKHLKNVKTNSKKKQTLLKRMGQEENGIQAHEKRIEIILEKLTIISRKAEKATEAGHE